MREILFRGKRSDNGEWIYGNLVVFWDKTFIVPKSTNTFHRVEVIPETVGQYTGLTDANGQRIFEEDILQTRRYETYTEELKGYHGYDNEGYPQKLPGYTGSMTVHKQRVNDNYHAVVRFDSTSGFYINGASVYLDAICNTVIGNIHDNPELLEVE